MATAAPPAPPPPSVADRVVNDEPVAAEQYLQREREHEGRHEYIDGWLVDMTAAASWSHSAITSNLDREIGLRLKETECRTASRDIIVPFPETDRYAYPDLVVVCGEPTLDPERSDLLYDPTVIVEVLSPSTESYDRGEKFARYRQLDSLREYLLVAQARPHVEHYVRQEDGSWRFTEATALDTEITCPSLDATLPLTEIYRDIAFDDRE
jgi:Uma2 family endonuclease